MLRVLGRATLRQLKLSAAWAKHDPRERHWHLGPIGVHSECQGRGVGTGPLGSFLTMVDEQSSPAYLETDVDRNVVLYEKFGFGVIAEQDIFGVNNRFMWRAARPDPLRGDAA